MNNEQQDFLEKFGEETLYTDVYTLKEGVSIYDMAKYYAQALSHQKAELREELIVELLNEISSLTTRDYLWEVIAQRSYMSQSRSGPIAQARRDGFDIGKGYLVDVLNKHLLSNLQI